MDQPLPQDNTQPITPLQPAALTPVSPSDDKKKYILIGGLAVLLVTVLVIAYFLSRKTSISQKHAESLQETIKTEKPNARSAKQISNNFFSLQFPNTWTGRQYTVVDGGERIALFPGTGTDLKTFPHFDIEVSPVASSGALQDRVQTLRPLGLTETEGAIKGEATDQLSGTLPFTFKVGTPPIDHSVSKTFIFFTHKSYLYIIDYAYVLGSSSEDMQTVQKIIDSFTFAN